MEAFYKCETALTDRLVMVIYYMAELRFTGLKEKKD